MASNPTEEDRDRAMRLTGQFLAIQAILKDCTIPPELNDSTPLRYLHEQLSILANKAVLRAWEYAGD